jgi:hypothetical protein
VRATFALWKRTIKVNGEDATVFSGPLFGGMEITIWPVKERKSNNSPTHELVVSERREKSSAGNQAGEEGAPF